MKRKICKRLIPFLLTFLLVFELIPVSAFAEEEQIITEDTYLDTASYEDPEEADPDFDVEEEPDSGDIIIEEYITKPGGSVGSGAVVVCGGMVMMSV